MESITNTLQEILPTLEDWKNGIVSFMQNGISKEADNLPALIVIVIFSLLTCFFGLKMIRLWAALTGLLSGLAIGYTVGLIVGLDQIPALIAGAVAGIILAALSGALMLFGIFIFVWIAGTYLGISILNPQSFVMAGICAGIGLVLGLFALKFTKSLTIILTAAGGGLSAGFAISQIAGLNQFMMPYIIGAVLMILGIILQFFYVSKKANRKIIEKAEQIKQEVSVENDIEAAKSILDQLDEEPEEESEDETPLTEPEAEVFEEVSAEKRQEDVKTNVEELLQEDAAPQEEPIQDINEIVASEDDFEEETEDPQKKLEEAMKELERVKKELEEAKKSNPDA